MRDMVEAICLEDYNIALRKRISTCITNMRIYLFENDPSYQN